METITPLFFITLPSFFAISIKIWLLINSNKRNLLVKNWPLMLIFMGTGGTNVIEFMSFAQLFHPGLLALQLYYFSLIISFLGLFYLSVFNAGFAKSLSKALINSFTLFGLVLTIMLFDTQLLISGVQSINYSVTRVAGPDYWLFQLFALLTLGLTIVLNVFGLRGNDIKTKKCKATLICFLPYAVSVLFVIILMQLGYHINASIIVPLATTYLLLALVYVEDKDMVFKILLRTPYSRERQGYKAITREIEEFLANANSGTKSSLKQLTNSLEKHIVSMAVDISNGSQIQAASLLNTSASSICRKKKAC